MQNDDLAGMTGESNFKTSFSLDEITLDGDLGRFNLRPADGQKDEATGKWPRIDLDAGVKLSFDPDTGAKKITETKPLKLVMLKIRRRMSYFEPGFFMNTQEHNTKADFVVVYGAPEKTSGIAADVWQLVKDKFSYTLKTQQIVYCYSPELKKVVRLIVKGASLSNGQDKPKVQGVTKFYDYLKSFSGDDHFYNFVTELVPVAEEGPKGLYFALNFVRGERLTPEQQERVNDLIRDTHATIQAVDESFMNRNGGYGKRDALASAQDGDMATLGDFAPVEDANADYGYPVDDINPADIPF